MRKKIAIAIHGGAGEDSHFIREHKEEYLQVLKEIILQGYTSLENRESALNVVQAVVMMMEDNYLFNAGKGSALNEDEEVEMDSSIMEGKNCDCGAVAAVKYVKNPILLARKILDDGNCDFLGGEGAFKYAGEKKLPTETMDYFITEHQKEECKKHKRKGTTGTVGAVAVDYHGNIAAATSTGGMINSPSGRLGDSCTIGSGCYANNKTCAVSSTGKGEFIIKTALAKEISMLYELTGKSLQKCCEEVINERNKHLKGDMGVITLNTKGEFGITFNCKRMHRAWISSEQELQVKIYK
jgi:beta-aspartyl-peptidase (threonine type)